MERYHENGKIKAIMTYRPNSERVFASLFDEEGKLYAKGYLRAPCATVPGVSIVANCWSLSKTTTSAKERGRPSVFDQNGKKIWERELKNDLEDGNEVQFDPSGIRRKEIFYKEGKKVGQRFYDENSVKTMEGSYLDDLSDGTWKVFGKDGKLQYQIKYDKGEIVNKGTMDTLQINTFKQYDKIKGKIRSQGESGMP